MNQCQWSHTNLCQVFVLRGTDTKPTCDGRHSACLPSRGLNLEDIRHRKPAPPWPKDCPDPLCTLDLDDPTLCHSCPTKPKPHANCPIHCEYYPGCQTDPQRTDYCPRPRWGGRRAGAGAPRANLNHLVHGRDSKLLKVAVDKLAEDPELRAFLLLLARAATTGEIPQTTKQLITRALGGHPLKREAASIHLKKMREGVSYES